MSKIKKVILGLDDGTFIQEEFVDDELQITQVSVKPKMKKLPNTSIMVFSPSRKYTSVDFDISKKGGS